MYEPGSILVRKEPVDTEGDLYPYNRVRVVGPSPVSHSGGGLGSWSGIEAQGVIIEPLTSFAMNSDEPFGRLQAEYDVESIPEHTGDLVPQVTVITPGTAGPSPEEVFKAETEETDHRLPEDRVAP